MTHKRTWACDKPDGDGCDGNHTPEQTDAARAAAYAKYPTSGLCGFVNINAMRRDGFEAGYAKAQEDSERSIALFVSACKDDNETIYELIAERDALKAENERQREALAMLLERKPGCDCRNCTCMDWSEIIREALADSKGNK